MNEDDLRAWRRKRQRHFGAWVGYLRHSVPPELEVADCSDLIAKITAGDAIIPFDGDMPQADSLDSYNHFARHNPYLINFGVRTVDTRGRKAVEAQEAWEAEQRQRRQASEAAATAKWQAEEERRQVEEARRQASETAKWRAAQAEEVRRQASETAKWRAAQAEEVRRQARVAELRAIIGHMCAAAELDQAAYQQLIAAAEDAWNNGADFHEIEEAIRAAW